MKNFTIFSNIYLATDTKAYYSLDYYGGAYYDATKFILDLKNTFHNTDNYTLFSARKKAETFVRISIQEIMRTEKLSTCTVVAVPRAKALDTYFWRQLLLIEAISNAAQLIVGAIDGTTYIQRHTNTKTTHLSRDIGRVTPQGNIPRESRANDGVEPYPGITKDTCNINSEKIKGQTIILVDDIYTKSCNVDEDCIQALYDFGAKSVIFYSLAKTYRE